MKRIKQNIDRLRSEIPAEIKIMAVTKGQPLEAIITAIDNGIDLIGENRIQEAREKFPQLPKHIKKHLIGHLQTNKAKDAVALFDLIESIDSEKLAHEIDKQARKIGKKMQIYIQVNISREHQKSGILEENLDNLIKVINTFPNLELKGFMAIAEDTHDQKKLEKQFALMHSLKNKYNLPELSMGMSQEKKKKKKKKKTDDRHGYVFLMCILYFIS